MTPEVYNEIMKYQDQFISHRQTNDSYFIALYGNDKETGDTIIKLCRDNGLIVRVRRIGGKSDPYAEVHLNIK